MRLFMLVTNTHAHRAITPPTPRRVVVPKESLSFGANRSSRMQYVPCAPKQHPFWPQGKVTEKAVSTRQDKAAARPTPLCSPTFARSHLFTATAIATTPPHMRAYVASLRSQTDKPLPKDMTSPEAQVIEKQRKTALKERYVAIAETRERVGASQDARIKSAATLQASLKQEKNDIASALEVTYKKILDRMNAYPPMSPRGRDLLMRTKDRLVTMRADYLALEANPEATKLLKSCWSKASDLNKFACHQLKSLQYDLGTPDKLAPRLVGSAKTKPDPVMDETMPESGLDRSTPAGPVLVALPMNEKAGSESASESIPESSHDALPEPQPKSLPEASGSVSRAASDTASRDDPRGARPKDGAAPITTRSPETLANLAAQAVRKALMEKDTPQINLTWELPATPPPGQAYLPTAETTPDSSDNDVIGAVRAMVVNMRSMIGAIDRAMV
jgi:hypothetical protein